MAKRDLPLSRVYSLIEPGPVVLLSTAWRGKTNVMTLSWLTMMEFEPPLIGCIVSNRNHSFEMLRKSKQGVINIPEAGLIKKVVAVGNSHGDMIDKFDKFGLAVKPAAMVNAPLITDCFANLECEIFDAGMVNKYCLFVLEVVKAWKDTAVKNPRTLHHEGYGKFMIAGRRIQTTSRMK